MTYLCFSSVLSISLAYNFVFANIASAQDYSSIESALIQTDREYVVSLRDLYTESIDATGYDSTLSRELLNKLARDTDPFVLAEEGAFIELIDLILVTSANNVDDAFDFLKTVWMRADFLLANNPIPEQKPYLSVRPKGTVFPGGVDPSVIDDPELRRQYEQDIRHNQDLIYRTNSAIRIKKRHENFVSTATLSLLRVQAHMTGDERKNLIRRLNDSELAGVTRAIEILSR